MIDASTLTSLWTRPVEATLLVFTGIAAYQAWTRSRQVRRETRRVHHRRVFELLEARQFDQACEACQSDRTFWGAWLVLLIQASPAAPWYRQSAEQRWRSHLPVLGGLAAIATLLGLLGTIVGLYQVFDTVGREADPAFGWSGAISSALVTTQLGLAIALPVLLAKHRLARHLDRTRQVAEADAARIQQLLGRE